MMILASPPSAVSRYSRERSLPVSYMVRTTASKPILEAKDRKVAKLIALIARIAWKVREFGNLGRIL